MDSIFNKTNFIYGGLVTFLSAIFGKYWFLFAGFLLFNVIDWLTGWYSSWLIHQESSAVGLRGIIKKVSYWIVIGIAFYIGIAFSDLGVLIGINIEVCSLVGYFVLASFLVNEIRSVLENLVKINADAVPEFLIKGLKVADDLIKEKTDLTKERK